jgi:hypothetical protein
VLLVDFGAEQGDLGELVFHGAFPLIVECG